jgi:hypothetical protein
MIIGSEDGITGGLDGGNPDGRAAFRPHGRADLLRPVRARRRARLVPPSAKLPGPPRVTPGIVLAATDHDRNGGRTAAASPGVGGGRGAGSGRGSGGWNPGAGGYGAGGFGSGDWDPGPGGHGAEDWNRGPGGRDTGAGGAGAEDWDTGGGGGWDSGPGDRWEQEKGSRGAELASSPPIFEETGRQILDWARARSLGASSVLGISVVLTLCAVVWLTAGTRSGNFRASAALLAGYAMLVVGRGLLTRPGVGGRRAGRFAAARPAALARTSWLATLGWTLAECVIYAGLAIGAAADHWPGVWTLAIAVLSLVGVRELMAASAWPAGPDDPDQGPLRRAAAVVMRMPAGGRLLLIGLVGPVWGNRAVLFALLDWTIIAIGLSLASQQGPARKPVRPAAPELTGPGRLPPAAPPSLAVLLVPADGGRVAGVQLDGPPDDDTSADAVPVETVPVETVPVETGAAEAAASGAGPDGSEPAGAESGGATVPFDIATDVPPLPAGTGKRKAGRGERQRPETTPDEQAWRDRLIMLRDDGALARYLGGLVRGNLLPLPPAVLGLVATALLAHLGLRSLPGILVLSPGLIMLLAAPGSSNRHAGRLDWLVPAVLLGWQCLYIATVGQAQDVPTPVSFTLCAVLMIRFADLACPGRPVVLARPMGRNWAMEVMEADRERGTALGWEGRMLLLGAGAAAGIGMFAYLALTAYLGGLICVKVLISSARVREGEGR